jgi:hypothetical protein
MLVYQRVAKKKQIHPVTARIRAINPRVRRSFTHAGCSVRTLSGDARRALAFCEEVGVLKTLHILIFP